MSAYLRIVCGDATPEEIAALVAVLATRQQAAPEPAVVARSQTWRNPARAMRKAAAPGKSGWRMSALPR
ncbi:acyl-CoA carboxylase subunit epsilon [Nonomuraea aurantiaca]|uniref:acyl-CoA carboxylase subunit epsilon n=1 Tax=Nonomuraea aurantiaca TaxID=2878562 RepID=UPI001CD9FA1E|nr:acyl-CoA carboxylase subunit epsilon [Nonomuraea aurantiaca]MCA2224248.1 acyl-CoA carboxylase subunit epsilon [Nonomuraea aurantiaca]